MKRLISIALVVLALAAVPAAFADDTAPVAPTAPAQQQAGGGKAQRQAHLRLRIKVAAHRFHKRCGSDTENQRCVDAATKAAERLAKLDAKVQARIDKIQETCGAAGSTEAKCKNADKRVQRLQRIDERIQKLAAKVQAWLDGTATSSLDDTVGAVDQLAGSNG
jgi:hypothetical protein